MKIILSLIALTLVGCSTGRQDDFVVHYSSATQPRQQLGYINMPKCWWSCAITVTITDSEGRNAGGSIALTPTQSDDHSTSLSVGTK